MLKTNKSSSTWLVSQVGSSRDKKKKSLRTGNALFFFFFVLSNVPRKKEQHVCMGGRTFYRGGNGDALPLVQRKGTEPGNVVGHHRPRLAQGDRRRPAHVLDPGTAQRLLLSSPKITFRTIKVSKPTHCFMFRYWLAFFLVSSIDYKFLNATN